MTAFVRSVLSVTLSFVVVPMAFGQPPMDLSPAEMVKRADTDGDGKLSRDEFVKARIAMVERSFDRMDADGDGKLDEKEAEAGAQQMRSMLAGGQGGFRRPDGERPQRPAGARPQRPGDEPSPRPAGGAYGEEAFQRLDRDGDGRLSREEFDEGMARLRASMQAGSAAPRGPEGLGRPGRDRRGPEGGFRRPPRQDDKDGGAERPPVR